MIVQRTMSVLAAGLLGLGMAINSQGALFSGTYTFSTANTDVPTANNGISFGSFTPSGVTEDTWNIGTPRYGASGWGTTFGNYVSFALTPSPAISGYSLTSLGFDVSSIKQMATGTGNGKWEIWTSTLQTSGTFDLPANGSTSHIGLTPNLSFSSAITIRFYGLASNSGKDSDLAFDNVALTGVSPVPEPVNVALGIFGGVFMVVIVSRSQTVRNRVQRWRNAVVQWIDAV